MNITQRIIIIRSRDKMLMVSKSEANKQSAAIIIN